VIDASTAYGIALSRGMEMSLFLFPCSFLKKKPQKKSRKQTVGIEACVSVFERKTRTPSVPLRGKGPIIPFQNSGERSVPSLA
jgi:hypothetical protein